MVRFKSVAPVLQTITVVIALAPVPDASVFALPAVVAVICVL
jgi:hypothetical protein